MIRELKERQNSADGSIGAQGILAAQLLGTSGSLNGPLATSEGTVSWSVRAFVSEAGSGTGNYLTRDRTSHPTVALDRFFEEIEHFQSLSFDWNGHGSEAPNEIAATLAQNALTVFDSIDLTPDRIAPSAEGGVGICFRRQNRFASIECLNSGEVIALLSDGTGNLNVWEMSPGSDVLQRAGQRIREHIGD